MQRMKLKVSLVQTTEVLIKGSMGLSFNAENSIFSVVRSYINADTTFNHNRFSACEF